MRPAEDRRPKRPVFIFDFGGVVIKWRNNNPIYDHISRRYGVPRDAMRRACDLALPTLETGDVSIREFLHGILGEFGRTLRRGDSLEELWTLPFERLVKFRAGTVDLVRSLRTKGYEVYLFSNTSLPHARLVRRRGWDKLFDGFLTSCELRSMKPSPTAFREALKMLGARPSEVVFIDDKEQNVQGAREYGIRWSFRFTSLGRLREDIRLALDPPVQRGR
jgi:HAD superfamily hydrolase (TIGR01509 family)